MNPRNNEGNDLREHEIAKRATCTCGFFPIHLPHTCTKKPMESNREKHRVEMAAKATELKKRGEEALLVATPAQPPTLKATFGDLLNAKGARPL